MGPPLAATIKALSHDRARCEAMGYRARAMLEEVLGEGTQAQKDEAKRLLAGVEA